MRFTKTTGERIMNTSRPSPSSLDGSPKTYGWLADYFIKKQVLFLIRHNFMPQKEALYDEFVKNSWYEDTPEDIKPVISAFNFMLMDPHHWLRAINLAHRHKRKAPVYVFAKDFFRDFKNSDLKGLKYSHLLGEGSYGTIILPEDIEDFDGDRFCEFDFSVDSSINNTMFAIHDNLQYLGQQQGCAVSLQTDKKSLGLMYTMTYNLANNAGVGKFDYAPKDPDEDICGSLRNIQNSTALITKSVERTIEEGYAGHVKVFFNCLAYLNSGDPDMRKYVNEIKFQGSSRKPVKRDRALSEETFTLVGYSYLKSNLRHVDTIVVPPHWNHYWYGSGSNKVRKPKWISGWISTNLKQKHQDKIAKIKENNNA